MLSAKKKKQPYLVTDLQGEGIVERRQWILIAPEKKKSAVKIKNVEK